MTTDESRKYTQLKEILEEGKIRYGDKAAIIYADNANIIHAISYLELYETVNARVHLLQEDAVKCVGLYGKASTEWIISFFAALISGKRTVLLDPEQPREFTQQLIYEFEIEAILPAASGFTACSCGTASSEGAGTLLLFSSGTSEANKAVQLSQKAICRSAWNGQQMLACGKDDVIAALLPLNHVFGLVCTLIWPLSYGAAVAVGRGMRYYTEDPSFFKTTILVMVPALLNYLVVTESINQECHTILLGAAACSERVFRAIRQMNIRLCYGYGLTETASGIAISMDASDPSALQCCPDTTVKVAGDGEILVHTPCMMEGYWHRENDTAAVFTDGFLHTGDLGTVDEEGRLFLFGRKKDVLVLANGEKMYLPEAEAVLSQMLDEEIALVLFHDSLTLVAAGGADEETVTHVVDAFNETQSMGRRIVNIRIIDQPLPKTAIGKLMRWKVEELL